MMHLKQIHIENFKCFRDLTLDLHPRLNVLVGENGAGKTAILDAIAVGLTPVLTHLSSANQRLTGPGIKDVDFRLEIFDGGKQRVRKAEYARIKLETTSNLSWDIWRSSIPGAQPGEKTGQVDLSAYCHDLLSSVQSGSPAMMPVFAYYSAQRGSIEHPERLRPSSINYQYPTAALAGALASASDFKEMLKWFNETEAAELRANRDAGSEEYDANSALEAVRESVELMLGGRYRNPHFDKDHKFVVMAKDGVTALQVAQLSQGYQSMLSMAADFARRLAIANSHFPYSELLKNQDMDSVMAQAWESNPGGDILRQMPLMAPAIMLVDEIDVHLHPAWQQRVLADLMQTFPGTQFIVTTHSPQVLSTVPSHNIQVLHENRVYGAPNGTEGAEASRILKRVFGVDPRPAENAVTKDLEAYARLVYADQWQDEAAITLRKKLDQAFQGEEPKLAELDLYIENRAWELSLENGNTAGV